MKPDRGNGGPEAVLTDDVAHQMAVFDALPLSMRRWLNQATFDYDARHAQNFSNQCIGMPIELVIQALDEYDRERSVTEHRRAYECLVKTDPSTA